MMMEWALLKGTIYILSSLLSCLNAYYFLKTGKIEMKFAALFWTAAALCTFFIGYHKIFLDARAFDLAKAALLLTAAPAIGFLSQIATKNLRASMAVTIFVGSIGALVKTASATLEMLGLFSLAVIFAISLSGQRVKIKRTWFYFSSAALATLLAITLDFLIGTGPTVLRAVLPLVVLSTISMVLLHDYRL